MKKRSYSYLLLELLIAFTLLTMCIAPFLSIPVHTLKRETLALQRIALQHVSDQTYALIKELIYQKKISWKELSSPRTNKYLAIDDHISLPIRELTEQSFIRQCFLYSSGKKGKNNKEHRIATLEVVFKKKPNSKKLEKFSYKLYLTRKDNGPAYTAIVQKE